MIFVIIVHVIVSMVLILVILLQAGKGGGLSESFGGASQQLFGTKSSTFLNRATAVCAILFLITCLSLGILSSHGRKSLMEGISVQKSGVGTETKKEAPKTETAPPETKPAAASEKKTAPAEGEAGKSEKSP